MKKVIVIASAVISILYSIILILVWVGEASRMFPFTQKEMLVTAAGIIFCLFIPVISLVVIFNIKPPKVLIMILAAISVFIALFSLILSGACAYIIITGHSWIGRRESIVCFLMQIAVIITLLTCIRRALKPAEIKEKR